MTDPSVDQPVSFALSAKNWAGNQKSRALLALPSLRPRAGAPVALQQSRTLRTSDTSLPDLLINPSQWGHFYFADLGDISTLH
jgi:hypothetical protein